MTCLPLAVGNNACAVIGKTNCARPRTDWTWLSVFRTSDATCNFKSAVCGVAATSQVSTEEIFVMLIQETKNVARCDSLWPHDVLVLALLTTLSIA